jgi:hypothetical protein
MEGKLNLKDVTLVCADDVDTQGSHDLLSYLNEKITFGNTFLFSSNNINHDVTLINKLSCLLDYDNFIHRELNDFISTSFCMIVQRDGFPINLKKWNDDFLKYDYIGAPWTYLKLDSDLLVGNSGFSIRSKKFLDSHLSHYNSYECGGEDEFSCRSQKKHFEEQGCVYAPVSLASDFSVECMPYLDQVGFHGKETLRINIDSPSFGNFNHQINQLPDKIKKIVLKEYGASKRRPKCPLIL